ncbi:hypothetical protein BDF22DRAFT_747207 [Syncephalis plumigaleata]|nr:hypothetical protein BDF22DRAFT_747207 [Syncephalis plumigaleata]
MPVALQRPSRFVILPYEFYQYLACYLEDNSVISLVLTCRLMYRLFTSWDMLWKSRYMRRFNLQDKREAAWLRGCLGYSRVINYTVPRWFHVYCRRMLTEWNLIHKHYATRLIPADIRFMDYNIWHVSDSIVTITDNKSNDGCILRLIGSEEALVPCSPFRIALRRITDDLLLNNAECRSLVTDYYIAFFVPLKCCIVRIQPIYRGVPFDFSIESIYRMSIKQTVADTTSATSQQIPTQENGVSHNNCRSCKHLGSIYKIVASGPWLMLSIKTPDDCYGFYHYFYHLHQRRWCSGHIHNDSTQMDSTSVWKSTNDSIQCISLAVRNDIGNSHYLRLLVWSCTLFDVAMRCIDHSEMVFVNYAAFTPWMTAVGQRVDDDRILMLIRYENGREAILYRPASDESVSLASASISQATKHVLWHVKMAEDVTAVELLLSTQSLIAISNSALYIYQLDVGACMHVIQLDFLPIVQHLLGHACMLKGNGMPNAVVLDTQPQ